MPERKEKISAQSSSQRTKKRFGDSNGLSSGSINVLAIAPMNYRKSGDNFQFHWTVLPTMHPFPRFFSWWIIASSDGNW
jgi:hypothetical protein